MNNPVTETYNVQYEPHSKVHEFWAIYCCLTRQAELQRLIRWAEKKRLKNPHKCYQSRLNDERRRISLYTLRSPRSARIARWLLRLNSVMNPTQRYYPRGSAVHYRRHS